MAFNTYGDNKTKGSDSDKPSVDFDEINKYVVETAKLEDRETLVGYVAQIVDLGTQELPDAENTFTGTEADEAAEIAKSPDVYFKNGFDYETKKEVRLKCYPQKPQQCVAFAIDFPEILVDKGQFFGESKPLPLRLWMGGQFYIESAGMVIGRPTPLRVTNLDKSRATKVWSMAQNSLPYKMALASKLIKAGEPFLPQRIDELLGKSYQFSAQVWFKESKGKQYYTEYVNFVGALGRGQAEAEHFTTPYVVQFTEENPADAIKELRAHVVNTIKRATNYNGSKIQAQIEALRGQAKPNENGKAEGEAPKPKKAKVAPKAKEPVLATDYNSFDDDIPFAPIGLQEGRLFLHMI
jgi:hypothetical protein